MNIIKLLKGLIKRLQPAKDNKAPGVVIPRKEHTISRSAISPNALKVLYRLNSAGYSAHLVGGCVRDLLLGRTPKDYDIATSARPEEVRRLFKNCRLIGRRFRLAHILFGKEIIEVATFRTHHENAEEHQGKSHEGMIVRDNVYGDIEDDALRRDFTINALYYNVSDFSVVDYMGGIHDIKAKLLRMIGDPDQRFQEDPVRLLRAIRFLGKLHLNIHPETESAILRQGHLLQNVSSARLFQEILKFFQEGATANTFKLLQKYHLFEQIFPQTAACLDQPGAQKLLEEAFNSTDQRIEADKTVSPAFLLSVFVWRPAALQAQALLTELPPYAALEQALQNVLKAQIQHLAIPRLLSTSIREICLLQHQLTGRQSTKAFRTLEHPRFRAAYDLLILRAKAGEPVQEAVDWWTAFNTGDTDQREKLLTEARKLPRRKKFRSRFKRKKIQS